MESTPLASMEALRLLAAAIDDGTISAAGELGDILVRVALAITTYDAGAAAGLTLDKTLGLVPKPGGRKWWTVEALRERDEALRRVRDASFPDLRAAAAAREMVRLYPRRQNTSSIPLAEAISTGRALPGERSLRAILADTGNEQPAISGQSDDAS